MTLAATFELEELEELEEVDELVEELEEEDELLFMVDGLLT